MSDVRAPSSATRGPRRWHWPRWSRTSVAAVLIGVCVALGPTVATSATPRARVPSAAIHWTVDHQARTITVSVDMAVYVRVRPDSQVALAALGQAAARIEADIRNAWKGLKFKCYQFIVDPHVRVVASRQDVRTAEIGVLLDTGVFPAGTELFRADRTGSEPRRSRVYWLGERGSTLSDAPPDSSTELPTGPNAEFGPVWAFMERPNVYAHEFGHIIGLHDNYEGTGGLVDGAPRDIMYYQTLAVSSETVTKLIRRSGQVDESKIRCPFSIDLPAFSFGAPAGIPGTAGGTVSFHAWACDYDPPTSDASRRRPIPVKVTFNGEGHADAGPFGNEGGDGESTQDVTIPPPFGLVAGSSSFVIPLSGGVTVSTPMRFDVAGLRPAGNTVANVAGTTLELGAVVVSEGAPECE